MDKLTILDEIDAAIGNAEALQASGEYHPELILDDLLIRLGRLVDRA